MSEARAAKAIVKRVLSGVNGVSGVGITWDKHGSPAILVYVEKYAAATVRTQLSRLSITVPIVIEEANVITLENDSR